MNRSKAVFNFFLYLLTVLFIYNSFGYLFLIIPAKAIIKKIVHYSIEKDKFNSDELEVLAFNLTDLNMNKYNFEWEEADKEFRFNGKMYDVKSSECRGDSIYYTCYYDEKESILDELFASHISRKKENEPNVSTVRIVLIALFSEEIKADFQNPRNNIPSIISFEFSKGKANKLIEDVPTPPPQLLS
jgi:hypothetical protein